MKAVLVYATLCIAAISVMAQPDPPIEWQYVHSDSASVSSAYDIARFGDGLFAVAGGWRREEQLRTIGGWNYIWLNEQGGELRIQSLALYDEVFVNPFSVLGIDGDGGVYCHPVPDYQRPDGYWNFRTELHGFDSNLNMRRSIVYSTAETDTIIKLASLGSNRFAMLGTRDTHQEHLTDFLLAEVDTSVPYDIAWSQTYGLVEENEIARDFLQTADGGYMLVGTTTAGSGVTDIYVVRTNGDGDTLWTRTMGQWYIDEPRGVLPLGNETYVIYGHTTSYGAIGYDILLWALNDQGDALWMRTYPEQRNQFACAGVIAVDGGIVLAGNSRLSPLACDSVFLAKFSRSGDLLWKSKWAGCTATAIQASRDSGYVIAGSIEQPDGTALITFKTGPDRTLHAPPPTEAPSRFTLSAYPNPFNPTTTILFDLPQREHIKAIVLNRLGQAVATLADETMNTGAHELTFDGSELSSGIYFVRVSAGTESQIVKAVLLK